MNTFHDVEIYLGTVLATTGSRLEIGANNKFLLEIFSGLINCARCKEPLALIFPEEEESTLREVFKRLSHFKSGLSIIESKPFLIFFSIFYVLHFRSYQGELLIGQTEPHGVIGGVRVKLGGKRRLRNSAAS